MVDVGFVLSALVALAATFSAISGLVVLEGFFRNKLKELFDDANYLIFFFLVSGYFMYGLGEALYFLTNFTLSDAGYFGVHDIYWLGGGTLILLSFISLSATFAKRTQQWGKLIGILAIGVVLALIISFFTIQGSFAFSNLYPIISSLIVAFALGVFFFDQHLGSLAFPLKIFFLASLFILLADVLFSSGNLFSTGEGTFMIYDFIYLVGYSLSGVAFLTLRKRWHSLANGN
jgi:hypothetical protein